MSDIRIFPDEASLSRGVARAFVERASSVERFRVALAGGSTPRLLYGLLATEYREAIAWERVHFFWSDERYVPPDHPDSNYRMVRQALFDQVDMPSDNLHVPPTGLEDPEEAARRYEEELQSCLGGEPRFDWVLLGLGEDGHTASLFPGASSLDERSRLVIVVRDSPKAPPVRLTLTLRALNLASEIHFLVTGSSKAEALRSTLEGPSDPKRFPAQGVKPARGTLTWWIDEGAAKMLKASG